MSSDTQNAYEAIWCSVGKHWSDLPAPESASCVHVRVCRDADCKACSKRAA